MTETDTERGEEGGSNGLDWRRLASVAGLIVLVVLVAPFVVFGAPELVGADHSYVVLSGSMAPTIDPGDAVIVEDVQPGAIERGDIITFARDGDARTTTHRVVEVVESDGSVAFRTKGDNNEDPDRESTPADAVEGRVMQVGGQVAVIPWIGHVIRFASTTLGFALLVAVPIAMLVLSEMWLFLASARFEDRDDRGPDGQGPDEAPTDDHDGAMGIFAGGRPPDETTSPDAEGDESVTAAVPPDEQAATTDGGVTDGERLTLGAHELQFGLIVLGGFCAYSLGVAVVETAAWSIAVAASVAVGFVLVAGLYLLRDPVPDGSADDRLGGAGE